MYPGSGSLKRSSLTTILAASLNSIFMDVQSKVNQKGQFVVSTSSVLPAIQEFGRIRRGDVARGKNSPWNARNRDCQCPGPGNAPSKNLFEAQEKDVAYFRVQPVSGASAVWSGCLNSRAKCRQLTCRVNKSEISERASGVMHPSVLGKWTRRLLGPMRSR